MGSSLNRRVVVVVHSFFSLQGAIWKVNLLPRLACGLPYYTDGIFVESGGSEPVPENCGGNNGQHIVPDVVYRYFITNLHSTKDCIRPYLDRPEFVSLESSF